MLDKVAESKDETAIINEIAYLLHVRWKGKAYDREDEAVCMDINKHFRELMQDFKGHELNPRVLVVLIETEFCQKKMNMMNKSDYPLFLI